MRITWSWRLFGGLVSSVVVLALWVLTTVAQAHPLGFGSGEFRFERGRYLLELVLDAPDSDLDEATRRRQLLERLRDSVSVRIDGKEVRPRLRVLSLGSGRSAVDVVEFSGGAPSDPALLQIGIAERVGDVALEVRTPGGDSIFRRLVTAGATTPELSLSRVASKHPPQEAASPVLSPTAALSLAGSAGDGVLKPDAASEQDARNQAPVAAPSDGAQGEVVSIGQMVRVGFLHIVPDGLDHMLFVLGLLLTSSSRRRLIIELSIFTLAHSITLGFSAAGWVVTQADFVEALIALSIGALGAEYFFRLPSGTRPVLVLGFGLLHGLGFASAFAHTGFADLGLWRAVLGFNLGVELGQLSVALLAWLLVKRWHSEPWFQARVLRPAASALLSIGVLWALLRFADVT